MAFRDIFGWPGSGEKGEKKKPPEEYSNGQYHGYGYGDNGRGRVDPSHEESRSFSDKQKSDKGLIDKEPL